jgi:serine/threonine-protein kinase
MHGDIKPANLLLATDGLLKVTDFGVASLVRRPTARGAAPADDRAGPPRLAGAVIGTPEYMAPELLLGGTPDVQSDLYAVGMVLQECLSGTTPFQGETPRAFFAQKFDTPPATRLRGPRSTNQPESLAALVAVLTAFEPEDRPVSAAEVAGLLAGIG